MSGVYLKFPSDRTFLVIKDMEKARNNKRIYFLFFNEEQFSKNFDIEIESLKKDFLCFYASPTKMGVKNITKKDGNFYVMLCKSEKMQDFFIKEVFPKLETDFSRDCLILAEESVDNGEVIEITEKVCSVFQVFVLDHFFPVSYSPFTYHEIDFHQEDPKKEILSLGNEMDFTISYLKNDLITVSSNFGELESLYEIDAMDIFVNSIMGHSQFKDISIVKDFNNYSMIADYTRRFPKVKSVSHIYSHAAGVMFDNGFKREKGICIVYDSVSYDEGDQIFGGEVVYGSIGNFKVVGGWKPVPLPGGDIANIEPWRIALALIRDIVKGDISNLELPMIQSLINNPNYSYIFNAINDKNMNYTLSSSMHHIVAALGELLAYEETTYDFDFFENKMDKFFIDKYASEGYWVPIVEEEEKSYIDTYDLFKKILSDLFANMDTEHMIYRAIASIASATAEIAEKTARKYDEKKVFLAGEFFKHPHFLSMIYKELKKRDLEIYIPRNIPVDDSGISVGQLIYHYYEK